MAAGVGPQRAKGLTLGGAGKGHIGMYPRLTPSPAAAAAAAAPQVAPVPTADPAAVPRAASDAALQYPLLGMLGGHAGGSRSVCPATWGAGERSAVGQSPQLILQEGLDALVHSSLQWSWQQQGPPPPQQQQQEYHQEREQGQAHQAAQQVQWQQQHHHHHQQQEHQQQQQQEQQQQQQWEEVSRSQGGAWRDVDVHAFQSACTEGMLAPALDLGGWEGLLPFTH